MLVVGDGNTRVPEVVDGVQSLAPAATEEVGTLGVGISAIGWRRSEPSPVTRSGRSSESWPAEADAVRGATALPLDESTFCPVLDALAETSSFATGGRSPVGRAGAAKLSVAVNVRAHDLCIRTVEDIIQPCLKQRYDRVA